MDLSKLTPQAGKGGNDPEEAAAKAEKAAQQEQMRREMIATVLESDARERCKPPSFIKSLLNQITLVSRIALVNPQLSAQVESILVRMAQSGQLRGRVSEQQLIGLLDQADGQQSSATAKKGAIVVRPSVPLHHCSNSASSFNEEKILMMTTGTSNVQFHRYFIVFISVPSETTLRAMDQITLRCHPFVSTHPLKWNIVSVDQV